MIFYMQREKQRQLNDIDVTVILKLHQFQCLSDTDKSANIRDCIVFDKTKLSQLYARVGELQQETMDQLAIYKNDKIHLQRMKADCESMKKELETLKEQIKKEMEQKFGQQVKLVNLYEAVLRRLIYGIKANTSSIIKFYDDKIKIIKNEYKEQLRVLKDLVENNTEKLGFLTVLEEELLKLRKTLNAKYFSEEEIHKVESQYEADLNKLKKMLKDQEKQKEMISMDIKLLSNKSKNLMSLDQLKSKTGKVQASFTLLDGAERDAIKHPLQDNYSKGTSTSSQVKEFLIDDSDYYKKIIAIRHLLSQVTAADETNTRATVEKMLKDIIEHLQRAGYCPEEIEKNISEIMTISRSSQEISQFSSKDNFESYSDFICRYSFELRRAASMQEIKQAVNNRFYDLFASIGIEDGKDEIAECLLSKLKMTGNINLALNFVMQKLLADTDQETKAAFKQCISQTLLDILKIIDVKGIESIQSAVDAT